MKLTDIYLTEAKTFTAPITLAHIPHEHNQKWFKKGLEDLSKYVSEGELTATEFKDLKDHINRGMEKAYEQVVRAPYYHSGAWENLPEGVYDLLDFHIAAHTLAGKLKKIRATKIKHEAIDKAKKLLTELEPIAVAVTSLKDKIVKKKKAVVQAQQTKEQSEAKILSNKDVQRVRDMLIRVTKKVRAAVQEANEEWLMGFVTRWKKQYDKDNQSTEPLRYYAKNPIARQVTSAATDSKRDGGSLIYKFKKGYKLIVAEEAKKMTDDILEHFISKNTAKLGVVVAGKNNLKKISLVSNDASRGVVEGTLKLEFSDGSSFTVRNKVVTSYSKYGKPFYKYPTTFHNVKMPDGSKLSQPSEARMGKEFLK